MTKRAKPRKPRRTWTRHPATRIRKSTKRYQRSRNKKLGDAPVFDEESLVGHVWKTMEVQARKEPQIALLHERLDESIPLVGLTGGIASGKSTIASFFREAGVPVIDADAIAREVVAPRKPAYRAILETFGAGILREDRTIDRQRLGEIVFSDESKRTLLESITHPEILRGIAREIQKWKRRKPRLIVVDAALLFESGLSAWMHKNLLVRTHPEVQCKRLMKRDTLTQSAAWQRILSQMGIAEKEQHADLTIDNSGTLADTRREFQTLLAQLVK